MNKATFLEYVAAYNAGDIHRVLSYYDEDVIFENFGEYRRGAAVSEFMQGLHHVVSASLVPRAIVIEGDTIALEADSKITALIDLPVHPSGAMHKGESVQMRMFAFYRTIDDRILHIRLAGWPLIRLAVY